MKVDKIIKQIGTFFVCFFVVVLVLSATVFFVLGICQRLSCAEIAVLENEAKNAVGIGSIDNEVLLSLLAIVLAFAAALSGLFYKIIEKDIKEKSERIWRVERDLSKAEILISAGVFHMYVYKTLYKERTKTNDADGKALREVRSSLSKVKLAVEKIKEVEEEKCLRQLFITKNNLAYYLARFWNYYREGRDEYSFKEYLRKNDDMRKKYKGDTRIAEQCIKYLQECRASEAYPDLSENFEDTLEWVEKVFGIRASI